MKRLYATEKDFIKKVLDYIEYCTQTERYPNIAGFCVYAKINRDSFYAQKEYYSDTYKRVQDIFEDEALNSKWAIPVIKIFYLKNKFGYADKIEQTSVIKETPKFDLSKLSDEELKQFKDLTKKAENDDKLP